MPMGKLSTLFYLVNNIENQKQSLQSIGEELELDRLPVMESQPSERTIKNILDFARSYDVMETESTGYVEMNLN